MDTGATGSLRPLSFLRNGPAVDGLPVIERIQKGLGYLPHFFRVQANRPDLIEAELGLLEGVIGRPGALPRLHKEYIFLVCAAANLSTYCVTAHCEIVRMMGLDGPEPEQVALDHTATNLPLPLKALLNFAVKLNRQPRAIAEADVDALRTFGYSEDEILEAVLTVGLARFSNAVSLGLGLVPDFDNPALAMPATGRSGA